jgi:TolB-like protein
LGIQKVKQNEFHAYDLLLEPSQKRKLKTLKPNIPLIGTITVVLLVGLIGLFYFNIFHQTTDNISFSDSNKTSLLVLPFELQSKGDEGNFMAKSITDHISTTLAEFDELFLFDKSSADYFLEQKFDYSDLNSEHGVQFLLEGSVQTFKSKIRVNIKLRNLEKNSIIWTEILDFEGKDIFEVQDAISNSIIKNIIPGALSLTVADARTKQKFTPEVHLNRLKGRVAMESGTAEGLYEYERLLGLNRELEPNNPYLDMDEAWLLMGQVWFGFADDSEKNIIEAYQLTLNTVNADPDFAYASNLAAMIERNHLGELTKACNRIDKLLKISQDESNISMVANLTRHCEEYEKSLGLFKKVLTKAPHFALWFKKDYAWTFLISSFDKTNYDYSEARNYIKSQLLRNYSEGGINEMWMTMLGYIEFKAGDKKSALKLIEKQKKMDFPVNITWKNSYPSILNENENFKRDFFRVLNELGVDGLK